jgi:cyclophilin family peptidyl-prolyl cis-trans isomerase
LFDGKLSFLTLSPNSKRMKRIFYLFSVLILIMGLSCSNSSQPRRGQIVIISTDMGEIKVRLYDETPVHRDNFVKLAGEGFFDGLLFHRVIKNFMVQGGDPESRNAVSGSRLGGGGPGYTLQAEILEGFFHKKGALAAARQGDQMNPERKSSGSQFYIVQGKVWRPGELDTMEMQRNMA